MNRSIKLLDALNDIDEQLLVEYKETTKEKNSHKSYKERGNNMKLMKSKLAFITSFATLLILIAFGFVVFQSSSLKKEEQIATSLVDLFSVKVYAATSENADLTENFKMENKETELFENVEILLANYSMLSSATPGLPIKIEVDNNHFKNSLIDKIQITTESGEIYIWKENGVVESKDKNFIINESNTIFWSPTFNNGLNKSYDNSIWDDKEMQTVDLVKISAYKDDKILEEKIIYIGEMNYYYYAKEKVIEYRTDISE